MSAMQQRRPQCRLCEAFVQTGKDASDSEAMASVAHAECCLGTAARYCELCGTSTGVSTPLIVCRTCKAPSLTGNSGLLSTGSMSLQCFVYVFCRDAASVDVARKRCLLWSLWGKSCC